LQCSASAGSIDSPIEVLDRRDWPRLRLSRTVMADDRPWLCGAPGGYVIMAPHARVRSISAQTGLRALVLVANTSTYQPMPGSCRVSPFSLYPFSGLSDLVVVPSPAFESRGSPVLMRPASPFSSNERSASSTATACMSFEEVGLLMILSLASSTAWLASIPALVLRSTLSSLRTLRCSSDRWTT